MCPQPSVQPTKNTGFIIAFACIAIFAALVFAGLIVFNKETPSLQYTNLPFPVNAKTYTPGDVVSVEISRCSKEKSSTNYVVAYNLVSMGEEKHIYMLRDLIANIPPGCVTVTNSMIMIPPGIPPGKYKIAGNAEVKGIFRTHYVQWESQVFEIIKR